MLNPWMLLGLLGLGIPVIIHLIREQRMRPRLLATLRFLDRQDVANTFAPTLRDMLQLLLRLLLIMAFVLLMVRFTRPAAAPSPRAVTIVLDNSLSMQREVGKGITLFDTMRRQARELVDGLRDADAAAVILVGDRVFSNTGLIRDRAALRQAVDSAWVSSGGARSLIPAIRRALAELQGEPAPDRMVVVFSDLRREMLAGASDDPALRRQLASGSVRLVLIGKPLPKADNMALEQVAFHPPAIHVGDGGKLTARIRNYGEREGEFDIGLKVASNEGETRRLTLGAGAAVFVDLVHSFVNPADVGVAATVRAGDPLPPDDRCQIPMRIRSGRQILLVAAPGYKSGDRSERGYSGADILSYAINPEATLGQAAGSHTQVRRITPAVFANTTLSSYDALIFYGVDALPESRSLEDLRQYVASGKGIWLIPDRGVTPTTFNDTFGDLMGGAKLGILREPQAAVFASRGEASLGSQLLRPLVRGEWGNPDEIPILRYWSVQQLGSARGALRTRDGSGLAAVAEIGRGRVFIQFFDCDIRSTAFPRSTAFLPMVQTVLGHLAGGDDLPVPDVMRAGATHDMHLPAYREIGGEVLVRGPATFRFPVDPEGWVRIGGIYIAGQYVVTHPGMPGRTRILTVNPVTGQSDLTPSEAADISRVFGGTRVSRLPFESLPETYTRRQEVSTWLLVLVLVALAVEAVAGAWFTRRKESVRA